MYLFRVGRDLNMFVGCWRKPIEKEMKDAGDCG